MQSILGALKRLEALVLFLDLLLFSDFVWLSAFGGSSFCLVSIVFFISF